MKPIDLPPDNIADILHADLTRPRIVESISDAADDQHVGTHPPHPPHVDPPDVPGLPEPPFPPGGGNTLEIAQQVARRQWEEERQASTRVAIQNSTRPSVPLPLLVDDNQVSARDETILVADDRSDTEHPEHVPEGDGVIRPSGVPSAEEFGETGLAADDHSGEHEHSVESRSGGSVVVQPAAASIQVDTAAPIVS
jgi:hypothetical protein